MNALVICLYIAAGLETINALVMITKVGADPARLAKSYTGGNVAATVAVTGFIIAVLVVAGLRLG